MSLMTWNVEEHGTKVGFADEEHQGVFANLNKLYDISMSGADNAAIAAQLDELINCVSAHFEHEEREMKAKNFSGYEKHKEEHDVLIETCTQMQVKVHEGDMALSERVCHLIKFWFEHHIPEFDRAYADVLNS